MAKEDPPNGQCSICETFDGVTLQEVTDYRQYK